MAQQNGNWGLFDDGMVELGNEVESAENGVGNNTDSGNDIDLRTEATESVINNLGDGKASLKAEGNVQARQRRQRVQRSFPAAPFEEALEFAIDVHRLGAGRIRRLRLFELLERSPDSGTSRQLITNSNRYGLTTGSYAAEWLELTADGRIATADDVPEREKIRVQFKLAIEQIAPFASLHERFINTRLPAKTVLADYLVEQGYGQDEVSECVDTFLLNARFVRILQTISGAERLVPLDHVLDYAPAGVQGTSTKAISVITPPIESLRNSSEGNSTFTIAHDDNDPWSNICFYITPIGSEESEQRLHADLFLGSIIEPALEEFGLKVVRADQISAAGMISRQMIEHIIRSRLVIADLSYHNPNVFYELGLRHDTGRPTVQIMRGFDQLPFDVNQVRTIVIDTSSIYALVPKLDVHRSAIASQVRRALQDPDAVDNPVTPFYNAFKVRQS